jgi:hypothetical protein
VAPRGARAAADRAAAALLYPYRYFTAAGGLISYGPDLVDQYRLAARRADGVIE